MTDVTANDVREATGLSTADEQLLRQRVDCAEHVAVQAALVRDPRRRLSMGPDRGRMTLCIDEKSRIPALDRVVSPRLPRYA